jgi:hypothetical protein
MPFVGKLVVLGKDEAASRSRICHPMTDSLAHIGSPQNSLAYAVALDRAGQTHDSA